MKRSIQGGLLVVVEGVDGAGKSSVMKCLSRLCEEEGLRFVVSREPSDGVWGRKIRASASSGRLPLEEELDLFMRDRREHVESLISPALEEGSVVILDRYYLSTAAYQGARGADPEMVLQMNEEFAPKPDLVLLLDCPPEITLQRIRSRGSIPDEFERLEALEAVRRIFLSIKRSFIRVIDASANAEIVGENCVLQLASVIAAKS